MSMNRRIFFPSFAGGISGSFLLGTFGGLGPGAACGIAATRRNSRESYSQQGEDLIVESIFEFLRIENPTYLDIGAADPIRINNTYLFYRKGSRGVLVEPNPVCCRSLKASRPGDKLLNIGIGVTSEKESDYYMISGGGDDLNTFSKEMAEGYPSKTEGRHSIEKVIKMSMVGINEILEQNFRKAPDFVSIDTEGIDLDILKSLDFGRFRPGVFCVETLVFGTTRVETKILDLMSTKGYSIRGSTFVNTIFVDDRLLTPVR
jgi:FkbM family methyltransferase